MYRGKKYHTINFTKKFNCHTEQSCVKQLIECKEMIDKDKDPFSLSKVTLDDYFNAYKTLKIRKQEWTNNTPVNMVYFYNKHIKESIGSKPMVKITTHDLEEIQDNMQTGQSSKNQIKKILKPIFEKQKKMMDNPTLELKTLTENKTRTKLNTRSFDTPTELVVKLYKGIPNYRTKKPENQKERECFLYLSIMTGHRYGELLKLKAENINIKKMQIVAPSEITKTDSYVYPFPSECNEYIKSVKNGLLFPNIKHGSVYTMFKKVVRYSNIELVHGQNISMHDLRRVLMNVMIDLQIEGMVADSCLGHAPQGVLKHYLQVTDTQINNAYSKYWEYIRLESENTSMPELIYKHPHYKNR